MIRFCGCPWPFFNSLKTVVLASRYTGLPEVSWSAVISTLKRRFPAFSARTTTSKVAALPGSMLIGSKVSVWPSWRWVAFKGVLTSFTVSSSGTSALMRTFVARTKP